MQLGVELAISGVLAPRKRFVEDGAGAIDVAGPGLGLGKRPISRNEPSRSASRCSAGAPVANRNRPHSAIGCKGVFCRSCDALHSTHVCGVSANREWNSSTSRDLPRPGSPTINTS
jgi:hypothetical protein